MNKVFFLIIAAAIIFALGCTPFRQASEHTIASVDTVSLDVPFVAQQQTNDCGPAALASVLHYRGIDIPLEEITDEVYIPALGRTLMPDMENYARDLGRSTRSGRGNIEFLKESLDEADPVIVLMEAGSGLIGSPHYIVIWGYTLRGFIAHIGKRPNAFIEFDELERRWKEMNSLYLVVE